ncbi:MAG: LysR substrate-binding domain-containing protein [Sulfitobacter sp.]
MRIRQLEAFRATVISGTISAAAQGMRTTQPTVSRLLIQLEEELSIELFRREKGRLHLTSEGKQFYIHVDKVFTAFTELNSTADLLRTDAFREVRILATPALSMTVVPELVSRLVQAHPDLKIKLMTLDNNNYFDTECETANDIIIGPRVGHGAKFEQTSLAHVNFVCVIQEDHRLAQKAVITTEDLDGEAIISLLDDQNRLFLQHEQILKAGGIAVEQNIFCHSSAAAYAMVQRSLGVALMEPFSAPLWENFGVVTRPFKPDLTYEFVAGSKPGTLKSAAMGEVIQTAREVFDALAT